MARLARRNFLLASCAGVAVGVTAECPRLVSAACDTLWVWRPIEPEVLCGNAKEFGIGRLLLWIEPGFAGNVERLRWLDAVGSVAQRHGIALDALGGDPSWATRVQAVESWAAEVKASERFERLHMDIEPHALPGWSDDRASLLSNLVDVVARAKSTGLPVDVDIPAWYWSVRTTLGEAGDDAVMRVADSVTLMAYQDSPAKILSLAGPSLLTGARIGKPVYIGVNIADPSPDVPQTSLFGQPRSAVLGGLEEVREKGKGIPCFGGIAIHDAGQLGRL
jgi:hypothetical protein